MSGVGNPTTLMDMHKYVQANNAIQIPINSTLQLPQVMRLINRNGQFIPNIKIAQLYYFQVSKD